MVSYDLAHNPAPDNRPRRQIANPLIRYLWVLPYLNQTKLANTELGAIKESRAGERERESGAITDSGNRSQGRGVTHAANHWVPNFAETHAYQPACSSSKGLGIRRAVSHPM